MSLTGRVAVITGAGSGIGRATAQLFSSEGAKVALVGRRVHRLTQTSRSLEGASLSIKADISKALDAKRIIDETLGHFGRVDILVNNAGIEGPNKTADETTEEEWNEVMDVNLKGAFLLSKFAIPVMKKHGGGVITNVSSNWGIVGAAHSVAYCSSKAGVILLTKAIAIDHAKDGIVANCICPGDVETEMIHRSVKMNPNSGGVHRNAGRLISPEEIAHAILYLASDNARMTTGTILVVDNGATASEGPQLLPSKPID